jgi:hypothetical protein
VPEAVLIEQPAALRRALMAVSCLRLGQPRLPDSDDTI